VTSRLGKGKPLTFFYSVTIEKAGLIWLAGFGKFPTVNLFLILIGHKNVDLVYMGLTGLVWQLSTLSC
jgi:hypothetical protein